MPRRKRIATGGVVFHALNRAVARERIFWKPADYEAFENVLQEAGERVPIRLLCYWIMPNHWHLVLGPRGDEDLSEYMRWLTVTHAKRWHAHYHSSGSGALDQGRFKSFPIQEDGHFLTVCRYVERNPLRANLVAGVLWRSGNEFRHAAFPFALRKGVKGVLAFSGMPHFRPSKGDVNSVLGRIYI